MIPQHGRARVACAAAGALVLLAALPARGQERGRDRQSKVVVVAGEPALTRGMITRVTDFFEWVLEAPLTSEQKARIESGLVEAWQKHSKSDIDGAEEILKGDEQVVPLPEGQRELVLRQLQPEILKALKSDSNDEFNKWLLAIYDAAHVPIAAGKPPLTRQISDAQAEMLAFMLTQASGETVNAGQQFRDDWAKWLKSAYLALPAERQAQWAQSPTIWASLRVVWARANEADRARLRKEWASALKGAIPLAKERAAVEAGLKVLAVLTEVRKTRFLTPAEMERGATDMDVLARSLRAIGAEGCAEKAAEVEREAAGLHRAAAEARESARQASSQPAGVKKPVDQREALAACYRSLANGQAYMSMSSAMMGVHYTNMNSAATMGGSPYRYVNAYGNPY